jgi:short-subunit dehydrogenase
MTLPTVIITGCGYKSIGRTYKYGGKPSHDAVIVDGVPHKMNIGSASAYYLSKKGIEVIMISRTAENLKKLKKAFVEMGCDTNKISFIASDITTDKGIDSLIRRLPKNKTFYWLQSLGIGGGTYKVPNDNIYLPFEKITPEIIRAEMEVTVATHRMLLKLVPIFRKQIKRKQKAKICIITSMSGERGYHFGATHVAAKHALVGYIKGVEKELTDEGIEIYDIRPGAIDTGMYDNPHVKKAVEEISRRTKMWKGDAPIYEHPLKVAEKVYGAMFGKNPKKVYRVFAPKQT